MRVDNFRELLLKKADGDLPLTSFILYCRDELLVDGIMETLEKMARARHKGDAANLSVRHFGTEMDPHTEPSMIRDALGHHVSRYKAALGGGNKDVANQHARQAFKLLNMADIAQKHSGGKLSLEHVSPHPWERNKYTSTYDSSHPKVQEGKYKAGDFVTKTKGLNYRGNDFSFLQQAPHESYKGEVARHGHNQAYPFEQTRVNGKYIPIEDVKDAKGYEAHPFDAHPIMNHFDESVRTRTPERDQAYLGEHDKYYNEQPHIGNYFDAQSQAEQADPEAYKNRGNAAAEPVHQPVEPLNIEKQPKDAPAEEAQAAAPKASRIAAPKADMSPDDYAKLAEDPRLPESLRNSLKAWASSQKGDK